MITKIETLDQARELSMEIIKNKSLTYEQKTSQLAKLAENLNDFPKEWKTLWNF